EVIVKEAEIRGCELLFQNCSIEKESQRGTLAQIRRDQQNLSVADEEGTGNMASDLLADDKPSVVQREVQGLTIEGRIAHAIRPCKIQPTVAQIAIERRRGSRNRVLSLAPEPKAERHEDWD